MQQDVSEESGPGPHDVAALVDQLRLRGVELWLDGGNLRYRGPAGAMTPEWLDRLRAHKAALITYLGRASERVIARLADQPHYALSHAQRRIWVVSQTEASSVAYNVPVRLLLEGQVEYGALCTAFAALEARHEALRTTIMVIGDEPRQVVHPPGSIGFQLDRTDVSAEIDPDARALTFASTDAALPFDLERGPLLRATLLQLGPEKHLLCLTAHHLVCDGWSLRVLIRDLTALYEAALVGASTNLDPLPIQYRDYAAWQNQAVTTTDGVAQRDYWLAKFAGNIPVLDLPCDAPRPDFPSYEGDVFGLRFDADETKRLVQFARSRQCSVFTVLLALIKVLLHRHTSQRDIVVGTAVAGRRLVELEPQVGCYINTLPLRSEIEPTMAFEDLLRRLRQTMIEALDHQDFPFDHLIDALNPPRDFSRSPVFDVMVVSQTAAELNTAMGVLRVSHLPLKSHAGKYDLTFDCEEGPDFIHIGIEYASTLFSRSRIERLCEHLRMLTLAVLDHPEQSVSNLPLLGTAEWDTVVRRYNQTETPLASETVIDRIAETVRRVPDRIAITSGEDQWTYARLWERTLQVSSLLRADGVGRGDRVGVLMERSPDLVATLLGVMHANAAYLPLDGTYPQARLAAMIDDSGARVIVCDAPSRALLPAGMPVRLIDGLATTIAALDPLANPPRPVDLAYVIYTSGSTGRPKGVQVPHAALANLLASMERAPGLGEEDVLLAVTTVCFDISVLELFLPLCVGAQLVIASQEAAVDGEALQRLIEREKVSVLQATPAGWRMLISAGWKGSPHLRALCGGEALTAQWAAELADRTGEIWNLYGPTETTCWSAARKIHPREEVQARLFPAEPIGSPIMNTQFYSLDAWQKPVPLGVVGELYIGGLGIAWGYFGRAALTAERFVPDPFSANPGARMYRTGDLVRSAPDGRFDFLGRGDQQVKLRGFRIELGEIETALVAHPDVSEAVVIARADALGEMTLVAYLVSVLGGEIAHLREFLAHRLPAYMIPSVFVFLPHLPLTANKKIDRQALPEPTLQAESRTPPRNDIELRLATLWEDVLGVKDPGVHDSFFELGGHSLRAVKLLAAIKREFGVSIALREFFMKQTIASLAETLALSAPARSSTRPRIGKALPIATDSRDPGDDRTPHLSEITDT